MSFLELLGLALGVTSLMVLVEAGPGLMYSGLQRWARWFVGADGTVHDEA